MQIRVQYWRGTRECEGTASTYRGAMRIAARNSNAFDPTFWDGDRKLIDDGHGLAYEEEASQGRTLYAV